MIEITLRETFVRGVVIEVMDVTHSDKLMPAFYYQSRNKDFTLLHGDCFQLLPRFHALFDMIFADPPYFLSNGGFSLQNGKIVSVNKGDWDQSHGYAEDGIYHREWIHLCRDKLKENGTIWISGTYHNIFAVAQALTELGFKILNVITWKKTNPPPNLSCRYFTHSTEFIVWARKQPKVPHFYNYELMKAINGGHQMRDVWTLPAIARWEKSCGKHPTQKPLALLTRIILASTQEGAWILDPFAGASTTGIAASLTGRRFLGIEREAEFAEMSRRRREKLEHPLVRMDYQSRLSDLSYLTNVAAADHVSESSVPYESVLPFA